MDGWIDGWMDGWIWILCKRDAMDQFRTFLTPELVRSQVFESPSPTRLHAKTL